MSLNLKIMLLNAENLFVFLEKYTSSKALTDLNESEWQGLSLSLLDNKSLRKVQEIAYLIKELSPEIMMLTEVGGTTSLENFNKYFLNDEYAVHILESNSDRGIDMGFLVKKNLPLTAKIKSFKDYPLDISHKKFSRDLLQLELFQDSKQLINLYLVHLKSKLNLKGVDYEGRTQRALEIKGLCKILSTLPSQLPYIIAGDFNGNASPTDTEPEFLPLYQDLEVKDVADLAQIPNEDRFSYIHFNLRGIKVPQQLDYAFLNKNAQKFLNQNSVCFPRYKTLAGSPYPIPTTLESKRILPSDHYPLWFELHLLNSSDGKN